MAYKNDYDKRFWVINITETGRRTDEFSVRADYYEIKDGFVTFYGSGKETVQSYQAKYVYSIRG